MKQRFTPHAFVYRAGIGIADTHITCDAPGFPTDLIFLSHANALAPARPALLAGARAGRRQVVTTEKTLLLLGATGDKLRPRALPAAFGRPFNLGEHRIELVHTGYLPGSAGLLCESDGRALFYVGTFCPEPLSVGVEPAGIRRADAICLDATFGDEHLVFPPRRQVLQQVHTFVQESLRLGKTPVLLTSPFGVLPALACELAQAGIALRAHGQIVRILARLRKAGENTPVVLRFAGKIAPGEVLLWPPAERMSAPLSLLSNLRLALVSGSAADPEMVARMGVEQGFPLTNMASFPEILAMIEFCGAREVALYRGHPEGLAETLRARGYHAYTLGPPSQMTLPGS